MSDPTPKRRVPRFSLRSLILFITLIASGTGLWYRWEPWVIEHRLKAGRELDRPMAYFACNGERVIIWDGSTPPKVYETASGRLLMDLGKMQYKNLVPTVDDPPNGSRLLLLARDKKTLKRHYDIWDVKDSQKVARLQTGQFDDLLEADAARFSPDGKQLVTWGRQSPEATVWDAVTGSMVSNLTARPGPDQELITWEKPWYIYDSKTESKLPANCHTDVVVHALFSPDGKRVLTTSEDKTARVWNVATGKSMFTLRGHSQTVLSAAFSLDESTITTVSEDATVRLWNAQSGVFLRILTRGASETAYRAYSQFSPAGNQLITYLGPNSLPTLWEWNDSTWQMTSTPHIQQLENCDGAAFSLDGSRVIIMEFNSVHLFNASTGEQIIRLRGDEREGGFFGIYGRFEFPGMVRAVCSPSGDYVVARSLLESHDALIWHRRRPEYWWGVAWLPEFWLTVVLGGGLVFSLWRDSRIMRT